MPLRRAVVGVTGEMPFRNGTELRDLLPLWNGTARGIGSVRLFEGDASVRAYRNGTESRDLLPLWNEAQSNQ